MFPLQEVTDAIDAATLLRSRFPNLAPIRLYSAAKRQRRVNFDARPDLHLTNLFYLGWEVIKKAFLEGILDADHWNLFFVGKDLARIKLYGDVEPALLQNLQWCPYKT